MMSSEVLKFCAGGGGQAPGTLSDSGYESLGTPSQTNHQRDAVTRGRGVATARGGAWGRGGGVVMDVAPRGGRGAGHASGGVVRDDGAWGGGGGTGFRGRGGAPAGNVDQRQNAALPPPAAESQEDDGVIYCQCSEPAALRTVRKDTPNKGNYLIPLNCGI